MSVDSVALEEYDYFEDVELEGYDWNNVFWKLS